MFGVPYSAILLVTIYSVAFCVMKNVLRVYVSVCLSVCLVTLYSIRDVTVNQNGLTLTPRPKIDNQKQINAQHLQRKE